MNLWGSANETTGAPYPILSILWLWLWLWHLKLNQLDQEFPLMVLNQRVLVLPRLLDKLQWRYEI